MHTAQLPNLRSLTHADIEKELREFEAKERARLGLDSKPVEHWRDTNPQDFVKADRSSTTLLCGGLTRAQDMLIGAALRGVGYRVTPLEVPDNDALRLGKEFGNRGQCNPTYFTVGNLVKHLLRLRDEQGMSTEKIIRSHVFVTAGACGPCHGGPLQIYVRGTFRCEGLEVHHYFHNVSCDH